VRRVVKSEEHVDESKVRKPTAASRPMTTGSFQSLVLPPHWSGRSKDVIMAIERKPPKLSSARNFWPIVLPS
jgi:hypothetical protein